MFFMIALDSLLSDTLKMYGDWFEIGMDFLLDEYTFFYILKTMFSYVNLLKSFHIIFID